MSTSPSISEQLTLFRQRDLFSTAAWQARGLDPSAAELSNSLTVFFHDCAEELEKMAKAGSQKSEMKRTLTYALSLLNKIDYDTEEREFMVDIFMELASIVGVDISRQLNIWLYGYFMNTLDMIFRFLWPKRVVGVLEQPCINCKTSLETKILSKKDGIPDREWIIIRCNNCGELNLLSMGPNISESRLGNYTWIDTLSKEQFTREQALMRMEQIKYFRKN